MLLIVGRISRPHGLRGEVMVELRTDDPQQRFAVGSVLVTDSTATAPPAQVAPPTQVAEPTQFAESAQLGSAGSRWRIPPRLTVETVRPHQGRLIVGFDGVYDRDLADELRGVLLCVDSEAVPPSEDPDEYHDYQLVGLAAVSSAGEPLGEVVRVDHAPASDLLVLRRPGGGTALVPFVKAMVPEVDIAGGRVVLTPPEGLLDL